MSKRRTLAHLQEAVASESAVIDEHGDELLEAAYAENASSFHGLGEHIEDLIAHHAAATYYSTQERPTPFANLAAVMLFNLRSPDQQSGISFVYNFLKARMGHLVVQSCRPPIEIGFKMNHTQACPIAETSFKSALQQVRRRRYQPEQRLVSAYHDDEGNPVLLRKSDIETTALTLVPIRTEGIILPPGVIVGVNKAKSPECTGRRKYSNYAFESWKLTDDDTISPLRLSAWAYDDPVDRSMFGCYGRIAYGVRRPPKPIYDRYRAEMLRRTSLEDFTAAASKIIELCAD